MRKLNYISLKTPTINTYPFYEAHYQFLNRNIEKSKRAKIKFTLNDVYNNTLATLDSLHKKNLISEFFYKQQLKMIALDKAQIKLFTAIKFHQSIDVDDLGFSLQDTTLEQNPKYLWYLENQIKYRYFLNQKNMSALDLFNFLKINKTLLNKILSDALLSKLLVDIYNSNKMDFKIKADEFINITHNINAKTYFKSLIKNDSIDASLLVKPNNSKNELTTLDNQNYDFKTLISNEKGKVVLVDFWASWCVPCIKEFSSLKKLKYDLKDDSFKIISISTDENFASWKGRLQLEKMDNVSSNYIINTKDSEIIRTYNITTIPRYLLFNLQGKLIIYEAPRPSNKNLKQIILKLLRS